MSERFRSHYHNLIDLAVYRERSHRKGIPVSYLPSIIPRSDGISVFGEGAKFSGITRHGNAEACLTLTASPHVAPTLPVASLVSATEATLGKSVTLPEGMQGDSSVSPQLILWWQEAGAKQPNTDMLRLSRLTPKEIEDFTEGMADLTVKASQIINHVKGPPLVWGSWGNGSPEERAQHGKSRGVPTNNFGHLHISHFDPGEQTFETRSDLPATERLNHYAPWNELFHKEFSVPIARKIETILDNFFGSEEVTDVIPISEFVTYPDGRSGSHFGYQVVCNQPQTFGTIYKILIGMSGTFENYYQRMNTLFEAYHKVPSQPQQRETKKRTIVEESMDFGFTEDEATKIMTFILGIKPTYGQLLHWERELRESAEGKEREADIVRIQREIARYDRTQNILGADPSNDSLSEALIRDTVTHPERWRRIERTWPVHSSAAFIIDDITVSPDTSSTLVKGLKLYPGIAASEACVERVVGMIVKRPLSY